MNIRFILTMALLMGMGRTSGAQDPMQSPLNIHRFPPRWKGDTINVNVGLPPLLVLVTDAAGRRVGADWSGTFTGFGMGPEINEIPFASIEQNNNFDQEQEPPTPGPSTSWQVELPDQEPHDYMVSVKGIQRASTYVKVTYSVEPTPQPYVNLYVLLPVLTEVGQVKTFRVMTSHDQKNVEFKRVVQPADLIQSLSLSCTLPSDDAPEIPQVDSPGVCQSLDAKARAIAVAIARGRTSAIQGAVKAFLSEVAAQAGKHIHEPAVTILREEAEALLNPPPARKLKPKPKSRSTTN